MKIYRKIERDIVSSILHGHLPVGASLPTEAALRERYGASRVSVRRALDELKRLEIVSATAGRGTEVLARPGGFGCELDFAVLVAPVHSPFFTSMMNELDILADQHGTVLLYKHDFDGNMLSNPDFYLKLLGMGARNLVLWPHVPHGDWTLLDRLKSVGMNIVVIDQEHETSAADLVALDSSQGMWEIIAKLRDCAASGPLLMLAHDPELPSENARQQAFGQLAGEGHHITLLPRYEGNSQRDAEVFTLLKSALDSPNPPAGIVCSHGGLGIAASWAIEKLGAKLPVGTFDYLETMQGHSLITLKQPLKAMAQATFDSLVKQSQSPRKWRASSQRFNGEIIVTKPRL